MAINLIIEQMGVAEQDGELTNVVKEVHWRATKTMFGHTASAYGMVTLGEPGEDFNDWNDVTLALTKLWMTEAGWNEAEIEAGLDAQLALLSNPPTVAVPPPWEN